MACECDIGDQMAFFIILQCLICQLQDLCIVIATSKNVWYTFVPFYNTEDMYSSGVAEA